MKTVMPEDKYIFNNNIFNTELINDKGKYLILYVCQNHKETFTTSNVAKDI